MEIDHGKAEHNHCTERRLALRFQCQHDWPDVHEIDTSWGPVYVFRDRSRLSLKKARAFVMKHRPDAKTKT
jgi:hypothetical protein